MEGQAVESGWDHFSHEADIGLHGYGPTPAAAFEQTALAMTGVMVPPDTVSARDRVTIDCTAPDLELLLADWLNALVYETAVRRLIFGRFDVEVEENRLHAVVWGESADSPAFEPAVEIKGATYTGLAVSRDESGTWHARCIVDV